MRGRQLCRRGVLQLHPMSDRLGLPLKEGPTRLMQFGRTGGKEHKSSGREIRPGRFSPMACERTSDADAGAAVREPDQWAVPPRLPRLRRRIARESLEGLHGCGRAHVDTIGSMPRRTSLSASSGRRSRRSAGTQSRMSGQSSLSRRHLSNGLGDRVSRVAGGDQWLRHRFSDGGRRGRRRRLSREWEPAAHDRLAVGVR